MKIGLKIAIAIASILVILGLLYGGYSYVKNIGYQEAKIECQKQTDKLIEQQGERIASLQSTFRDTANTLLTNNTKLSKDIKSIVSNIKVEGQPTTIIQEGACTPTPVYVKSLNDAIDHANAEGTSK